MNFTHRQRQALLDHRRRIRQAVRRRALLATRKATGEPLRSVVAEMFFFSRAYRLPRLLEQLRERVERMAQVDTRRPRA